MLLLSWQSVGAGVGGLLTYYNFSIRSILGFGRFATTACVCLRYISRWHSCMA